MILILLIMESSCFGNSLVPGSKKVGNFVPSFYTHPFLFGHSSHFPSYYLHYSKKSVSQDAFKEARHRNEDFQFFLGHSKSE
jgi:hypothetical protein